MGGGGRVASKGVYKLGNELEGKFIVGRASLPTRG